MLEGAAWFVLTLIICGVGVDALIIHVIRKSEALRKRHYNKFVLHNAILDIGNRLIAAGFILGTMETRVVAIFFVAELCSGILTAVDWYKETYAPVAWERFKKHTPTILAAVYLLTSVLSLVRVSTFGRYDDVFSSVIHLISLIVFCLILIGFSAIRLHDRRASDTFPLKNAFFKFVLCVLCFLVDIFFIVDPCLVVVIIFIALGPAEQLLLCSFCNDDFRANLEGIFSCGSEGRKVWWRKLRGESEEKEDGEKGEKVEVKIPDFPVCPESG